MERNGEKDPFWRQMGDAVVVFGALALSVVVAAELIPTAAESLATDPAGAVVDTGVSLAGDVLGILGGA